MLDYKSLLKYDTHFRNTRQGIVMKTPFLAMIILMISCFQHKTDEKIICGEEKYDELGQLTYKVECDSVNNYLRIFNQIKQNEYSDLYSFKDFEIEYKNILNERLEYTAQYKNVTVFNIIRYPGYTNTTENEIIVGSPIVSLEDETKINSINRAFYILKPSFSEITTLSIYKLLDNDSISLGQKEYIIENNKIVLQLFDLDKYAWKIEVKQKLNSGREYIYSTIVPQMVAY